MVSILLLYLYHSCFTNATKIPKCWARESLFAHTICGNWGELELTGRPKKHKMYSCEGQWGSTYTHYIKGTIGGVEY